MDRSAYLFDPVLPAGAERLRGLTLPAVIARGASVHGGRIAIAEGDVRLTYAELAAEAGRLAAGLHARGIGRGSVIGLHLANGRQLLSATVATALLGAVALPLHPPYRRHELQTLLAYTGARALFCPAAALEHVRALTGTPLETIVVTDPVAGVKAPLVSFARLAAGGAATALPAAALAADDPLSLNPTSGTESLRPKICIHTHDGLLSNSYELAVRAGYDAADRVLISAGYTHLFGMAGVQMALLSGAALYAQPAFDAADWLDLCARERITRAWVAPPHLGALLAEQQARPRELHLRELRTGGTAIAEALAVRVQAELCANVVIQWGTSEICGGATTLPGATFARPTLGTPLPGAEVRIVEGELWYRRADMFRGYLGDPELTAAVVTADGFVRTGDLAQIEADGSLTFAGRTKDLINRGGLKISAFELEALLAPLAALRQLAVVALPDERLGERTALVCSLQPGATLTLADVTAHLDTLAVAKFKWPEFLIVLDALPTTATGKVAKSAVRAQVAATLATTPESALR